MDHLLTQGGHLTDLTVDRYLDEDLSVEERGSVETHLEACEPCVEFVAEVRRFGDELPQFTAPPEPAKVLPFRKRGFTTGVSAAFALAAATLLAISLPSDPPDLPGETFTLKGPAFAWEVHVHDGKTSRVVEPGDAVKPGDRVGFRVQSKHAGHLAIFGADDHGEAYVAFPDGAADQAATWAATESLVDLKAAMAFDAKPGRERLVAVFCERSFALASMLETLRAGRLPDSDACTTKDLTLHKSP